MCSVEGEVPVHPLYSKRDGFCLCVCVCFPFCLRSSRAVGNNLLPLSLCAAPITARPLHLLCITATRSESHTASAAPSFGTFFRSPLEADEVLLCCPLLLSFLIFSLTSCAFRFPTPFGSRAVSCRTSPFPPSAHKGPHFHPPSSFFPLRLFNRPVKGDLLYDSIVTE